MFFKQKTYLFLIFIFLLTSCSKSEEKTFFSKKNSQNFTLTLNKDLDNAEFFQELKNDFEKTRNFYTNPDGAIEHINLIQKEYLSATKSRKYDLIFSLLKKFPNDHAIEKNLKAKHDSLTELLNKLYLENSEILKKELHFIWLGGPLGEAQKEYLKIWAETNPDYKISLWYDSDYLYSYETNSLIKEAIHKFQSFQTDKKESIPKDHPLENKSIENIIQIQNKLHAYLRHRKIQKTPLSMDEERIKFLNENIYKSNTISNNKIIENKKTLQNDVDNLTKKYPNIEFKDLKFIKEKWQLKNPYFQEINLRSNLAAASDLARIELLNEFGGVYFDLDILPQLKVLEELYNEPLDESLKKFIKNNEKDISLTFYKELVKNKIYNMSNRDKIARKEDLFSRIDNHVDINLEQKELLKNLLEEKISKVIRGRNSSEIFTSLGNINIRQGEFKTAIKSNCVIASHQSIRESDLIYQVISAVKENYKNINSYPENNPGNFYEKNPHFIQNTNKNETMRRMNNLDSYKFYRFDSIVAGNRVTISVSGPSVFRKIISNAVETEFLNSPHFINLLDNTFYFSQSNKYFSMFTQEDFISSWALKEKDNSNLISKNIILKIGNDSNTKKVANYIFESTKDELDTAIIVDDFQNNISKEEILSAKLTIVGHATQDANEIKIGDLSAHDLAEKINKFYIHNKINKISIIDFVTCNPTNDKNNTKMIENYVKGVMKNLTNNNIQIDIASARKKHIKVKSDGTELTNVKHNLYKNSETKDKIYIIQKNNEFLEIDSENIYLTKKSKATQFVEVIRNILASKSNVLGEFEQTISELRTADTILLEKEKITSTIKKIQTANSLEKDFIPILTKLENDSSKIDFIHSKTGEYKAAHLFEREDITNLLELKNKTNSELSKIASVKLNVNENGLIEAHGLGLTPMFMTQALLSYFRTDSDNFLSEDETLNNALKFHSILNDTQIALNVLETSVQIKDILKNIVTSGSLEQSSPFILKFASTNIQKIGMGANIIFNLGSIGLDAFELAKAKTGYEKIIFGTQLAFDLGGFSLGALQLGTSALAATEIGSTLGFATASSVIGYLGVPFTGLAIGFNGLAHTAAQAQGESVDMAHYFLKYERDHEKSGEIHPENKNIISLAQHNFTRKNNKLHADSNTALIQSIDLIERNKLKITFDSHYMYKTKGKYGRRPKHYSIFDSQPAADIDRKCNYRSCEYNFNKENSFSVLEALSLEKNKVIDLRNETAIVLPAMPKKNISYGYSYTIGIFSRNDAELKTVRKMEEHPNSGFLFEFMADLFEYAIRGLDFVTEKYNIEVKLGRQNRTLISPELEEQNLGHISYTFESLAGGTHTLFLSKDIQNYQFKVSEHVNWFIHAATIQTNEIKITRREKNIIINIGNSQLFFDNNPKSLVIKLANGNSYAIIDDKKYLVSIDGESFRNNTDKLKEYILNEKRSGTLVKNYKYVEKFLSNTKGVWVNTENYEIISPKFPSGIEDHSVDLVTEIDNEIFFYVPSKLQLFSFNKTDKKLTALLQAVKKVEVKGKGILIELNTSRLNYFSRFKLFLKNSKNINVYSLSLYGRYPEFKNYSEWHQYIKERVDYDEGFYLFGQETHFKLDDIFTINSRSWMIPELKSITYLNNDELNSSIDRNLIKFKKVNDNNIFLFSVNKFSKYEIYKQEGELSNPSKVDITDITDIQFADNEILVHTKEGLIFQLDENFNPILYGFDYNWLENRTNLNLGEEIEKHLNALISKYKLKNELYLFNLNGNNYLYNQKFKFVYKNDVSKSLLGFSDSKLFFSDKIHKIYSSSFNNSLAKNFFIKKDIEHSKYYLENNLDINLYEVRNQEINLNFLYTN
nr:hypothetical protein GTC16762_08840 [Pigmentibacter ruber]